MHVGQLEQFAPAMRPARGLQDRAWLSPWRIEPVEPGISIRLQNAGVIGQMPFGVDGFSVSGIAKHRRGRVRATKGRIITHIGPKPPHIGAARSKHRHGGVITMKSLGCQRMRIDQDHERHDRCGAGADPIPDRRGAEVDALSREGFAEPIERQVLAEFRLQNGGEEMRPRPAAHDRVKGCGRLSDGLTTAAGEFLPHRLDDFPLPRDDF